MASIQIILTWLSVYTILKATESAVVVTPNIASPTKGTTIRPKCTVTGEAFVAWYGPKGNKIGLVGRKHVETEGNAYTLVIKDVNAKDGGTYECHGNISSATVEVDVPFSAAPPASQKLVLNKKGKIFLGATGYPLPQYKWKKNGLKLDAKNGGQFNLLSDGSLEIPFVKASDAGKYECEINQGYRSKAIVIQISVIELPWIVEGPQTKRNVTAGYNTTFRCMGTGLPTPIITWLDKNERIVDQSVDKRFVITSSNKEGNVTNTTVGLLTIVGIKPEDKESAFTCKVSNTEGQNRSILAQITIVYVLPTLNEIKDVQKNLNDKVNLKCVASGGDPKPIVQWIKNGEVLPNQQKNITQSVMTISKVHLQDMGVYTCEAFNGAKDENNKLIVIRQNVVLDVQSWPILNTAKSLSVVWSFLGNPAKIVCEFDGNPIPNVTITFNDTIIAAGRKTVVYETKSATSESFGSYLCSATNVYGTSNHTVQLKQGAVPSKPQQFSVLSQLCHRFTLVWMKPYDNGGFPVTHYFVKVIEYRTAKEVITKTSSAESQESAYLYESIKSLKRNKKYRLFIRAVNEVGQGEIANITVTTKQYCKPHRPSIISPRLKTLKNTYVILEWKKPVDDGGDPNIRYRVVIYNMNNGTKYDDVKNLYATKYKVEGLAPGARYMFQVFASNREGESEPAEESYDVSKNAFVLGKGRAHTLSATGLASILCLLVVVLMIN